MIKEFGIYKVNGRSATFNASVEKTLTSLSPVARFVFENGEVIKIKHNIISGNTSVVEGCLDKESMVAFRNGQWEFLFK